MNYEAAPDFFQKVRLNPAPAAQALTLLILCASRLSEILGMRWDEIDIAAATWTLPPERQKKTGVAHIIPLSREALKILEEITKFRTQSEYVFPGRSWRKPISGQPLRDLMPPGATLHGWRSTFRDWAGDEAGVPREIAEGALAHLIGNPVERSYRRRTALERRRVVMEEWSAFLLTKQDIGIV
jgi:integrase